MKQLTNGASSNPLTVEHIDWDAYAHLQKICLRTKDPFKLEAIEIALEKAIQPMCRLATGEKLAEDLFRDGRKKEAQKYNPESRLSKNIAEYVYLTEDRTEPDSSLENNFKLSCTIIKRGLTSLPQREAIAIYLKFSEMDNAEYVKSVLNIGLKQYRNILKQARENLTKVTGFEEAFFLLILHAEESDLVTFFRKTIQKHLTLPKAA